QVDLYPITFRHERLVSVLGVGPLKKTASREARRVNSKVTFNRLQGQTARFDQFLEQRRQPVILQVARNRIVVCGLRQIAFVLSVAQVRHEAATGNGGVNLKRAGKDDVAERQARAAHLLLWFFYALAQLSQQLNKLFLFATLRF